METGEHVREDARMDERQAASSAIEVVGTGLERNS
jgi:hypothetical protein